ncbi:MAG: hypothetical protein GT589_02035 [Peptoclostridium sp.]|uniref:hypothetical protein n=1 Tax=Peptoclostridium sp. TaxID=1904860 RepID=UPI00139AC700|nr:hypothetical protein [Peptoclostridium sp.]MZQ74920.1 hypothetical protein [Peptoclostridium sp.]
MGYTHGIRWTDEKIEYEIRNVMKILNIDRMPSCAEIKVITGDDALTNKIAKTGGFYQWADRLQIEVKKSETQLGVRYELKAKDMLESLGYAVEKMSTRHPYDLLVNGAVKVDVKVAKPYEYEKAKFFHSFNLENMYHSCDIFMAFAVSHSEAIEKILIIPSKDLKVKQLSIGSNSRYDKYMNRWDYFEKYSKFMNGLN